MHRIKFEDGGSELLDLSEQEWSLDGPDHGLDIDRTNELRNEAYALDDEEAFGNVRRLLFCPYHFIYEI